MKVFVTGFNLYGQILNWEKSIIEHFMEFSYENLNDFVLGHSFSIVKLHCNAVLYHGANKDKTHQVVKINVDNIIQTSCNDSRILLLNSRGELFKLDVDALEDVKPLPKFVEDDDKIVKVECGALMSVALSRNGLVFNIPSRIEFKEKDIVDVKVGREHCLLLDRKGCVYSFGGGSRGQLGHGHLENIEEPLQVDALGGIPIKAIATGAWHSCALSEDGDLYTWGWNSNGQLGIANEDLSVLATPKPVDLVEDPCTNKSNTVNIVDVACGSRHTIVITENNKLYGCGWNKYKQLGIESEENVHEFVLLKDLKSLKVKLRCGTWNTVLLCQ